MRVLLSTILIALVLSGCAAQLATSDDMGGRIALAEWSGMQRDKLQTYGALMRVKLSRDGKIDDMRAELFSEGDSVLSVYVRGFLGKSVFKAVLKGDSLAVYFPDDKRHYFGLRHDLETGELVDAGHLVDFLLTLAAGQIPIPDESMWRYQVGAGNNRLVLDAVDKRYQHRLKVRWKTERDEFPYAQLEKLDWNSADNSLRINLRTLDQHYNKKIPLAKFALEIPSSSLAMTDEELVDALTAPR